MASLTILVNGIIQDDQTLGASNERMASRVFFDVVDEIEKKGWHCWVALSQPYATDYQKEPIEMGPPHGYPDDLKWNHNEFTDQIEKYYRGCLANMLPFGRQRKKRDHEKQ